MEEQLVCGACGSTAHVAFRGWTDEGSPMATCAACGGPDDKAGDDVLIARRGLAFARVAIRSGEPLTDQANETLDAAFAAVDRLHGLRGVETAINRLAGVLMPPAPDTEERYETWAHVELFGHRVLVGYVQEDEIAGRRFLGIRRLRRAAGTRRVGEPDPPLELEEAWTCYSPHAVYSFQALPDEAAARRRWVALGGGSGSLHFASDDRDDDIPF